MSAIPQFTLALNGQKTLTPVEPHWFGPAFEGTSDGTLILDPYTTNYNSGSAPWTVTLTATDVGPSGNVIGAPVPIASYSTGFNFHIASASLDDGDQAVFWDSADGVSPQSSLVNINVQTVDAAGAPVGPPTTLLTGVNDLVQFRVGAAASGGSSYVLTYATYDSSTRQEEIHDQGFTANGVAIANDSGLDDTFDIYGQSFGESYAFGTVIDASQADPSYIYIRGTNDNGEFNYNIGLKYELIGLDGKPTTSLQKILPALPAGVSSADLLNWTYDRLNPTTTGGDNMFVAMRYSYVDPTGATKQAIDVHAMNVDTGAATDVVISVATTDTGLTETRLPSGGFVLGYDDGSGQPLKIQRFDANGQDVGTAVALPNNETDFNLATTASGQLLVEWPSSATGGNQLNEAVYNVTPLTTGWAEDGYISGGIVFADTNGDGVLDNGEAETTTNSAGAFTLQGGSGPLALEGGTDTSTSLPLMETLTAPGGSSVITPLTTLVEAALAQQPSTAVAAAETNILDAFGLALTSGQSLTTLDPIAGTLAGDQNSTAVFIASAKVIDTVSLIGSALAGQGATPAAAFAAVFSELASAIDGHPGAVLNLSDKTTIESLVAGSATALGQAVPTADVDGAIANLVVASNAAMTSDAGEDSGGAVLKDVSAVQYVANGETSKALQQGDAPADLQTQYTGSGLSQAVAAAADQVACYRAGARILTVSGETPIEALSVGDLLVTASGGHRPVTWIGHRKIDVRRHPDPEAVWPVCVSAGAFGDNQPARDLWLSPGHNVFAEGVLIAIGHLVNGVTVVQRPVERVTYWHVELDAHDIILAEGLPAESYLDTGNRTAFTNGGAFLDLHANFEPRHWSETCAPLVEQGPEVTRAKAMLLTRAACLGHATTTDADPHLMGDGRRIEPISLGPLRIAFKIPRGCTDLRLASRTFIPAQTSASSTDLRALGLCVQRLQVDDDDLPLDDEARCGQGWNDLERHPVGGLQRWTLGSTPMPVSARRIVIDLAGHGLYWREWNERAAVRICNQSGPAA